MQTGASGDRLDRLVVIAHVVLVCTTSDRSLPSLPSLPSLHREKTFEAHAGFLLFFLKGNKSRFSCQREHRTSL